MANFLYSNLINKTNKKIISFSVYGKNRIYQAGAEKNVQEAKEIYPDWICRFYCHKDIKNLEKLKSLDCEVLVVDSKIPEMFWRFLAADDPDVDVFISRDTDSVVSHREKVAVEEWLNSDKMFHTMHDTEDGHWSKVMGGLWGLKLPFNGSMESMIDSQVSLKNYNFAYNDDQNFLTKKILPMYENSWCAHTGHKPGPNNNIASPAHAKEFPKHPPIKYGSFVGDRVSIFRLTDINEGKENSSKAFVVPHLGPDDHWVCRNAIQHIINSHEEVILPVKKPSELNVNYMFGGYKNVKIEVIEHDGKAFDLFSENYIDTHKLYIFGIHGPNLENMSTMGWSDRFCFHQMDEEFKDNLIQSNPKPGLDYSKVKKQYINLPKFKPDIQIPKEDREDKLIESLINNVDSTEKPDRNPLVSAIVSTYNRYNYVFNTIKSIKNQTYDNIEIIVIDDNSSDPRYKEFDWVGYGVKIIHLEKNSKEIFNFACSGGYQRNFGMRQSKGEYLAFCDDDDIWLPNKIKSQVLALENSNQKICSTEAFFGSGVYDQNKKYSLYNGEVFLETLINIFKRAGHDFSSSKKLPKTWNESFWGVHNAAICSSVMIHRDLYVKHGEFAPMPNSDDYEYWKRIIKGEEAVYLDEPHVYYDSAHGDGINYSWGK